MEESSEGESLLMLARGSDLLLLSLYGEVRICPEHDRMHCPPCRGFDELAKVPCVSASLFGLIPKNKYKIKEGKRNALGLSDKLTAHTCETILYTTIIPLPVCLLGRVLVVESQPHAQMAFHKRSPLMSNERRISH